MKRLMTLFCIALGLALSPVSIDAQPEQQQNIPLKPVASHPELEPIHLPSTGTGLPGGPRRESRVIRKGILAPAESDVNAHRFLLSLKDTGMMRLLPREWERNKVKKGAEMRGGGAYFSFYYRTHEYNYGSDVSYERGYLTVGFAGADYGFLTDLGDTPLEPIDASDLRAAFFLNYTPPSKENEARLENKKFGAVKFSPGSAPQSGITVDGVSYGRRVPAQLNHTYLLRSIVYDKSDLVVAFRVVSINEDGGLTIAWKILKEFEAPELRR